MKRSCLWNLLCTTDFMIEHSEDPWQRFFRKLRRNERYNLVIFRNFVMRHKRRYSSIDPFRRLFVPHQEGFPKNK